jgi:hypothetical protein
MDHDGIAQQLRSLLAASGGVVGDDRVWKNLLLACQEVLDAPVQPQRYAPPVLFLLLLLMA